MNGIEKRQEKKRTTEWEEDLRQIEEISELDEEKDKEGTEMEK